MNLQALAQETIGKAQAAILDLAKQGHLAKAVDLATGLTGFNLEAPAKLLVPLLSPFRQSIGRRTIPGTGTNWKRITSVTPTGTLLAAEATRANAFTFAVDTPSAAYLSYGRLGSVTWEGKIAGQNYEDVRAREESLLLLQLLKEEEAAILGGATTDIGAGPTPTVVAATSGGSLADATYFVMVVPLTTMGAARASRIARPTAGTNNYDFTVVPTLGLGDGVGLVSAQASAVLTGGSGAGKVTITFTPNSAAAAYALFIGTSTGAANLKLQGIVTQSEVVVTAINTTGIAANTAGLATDTSGDSPINGIHSQLVAAGSGAYIKAIGGPLSAAVGRGIPEIDSMLDDIYDRVKEEPDRLLMGWQEHKSIDDKMASVVNDRIKLNIAVSGGDVGSELPRFTSYKSSRGKVIPLEETPNMPGGMIIALKDRVDIPNSQVTSPWEMHMGSDVVRLDYAMTDPKDEFEMRAYGALAGYVPSFQGLIYDIHEA